MVPVLAFVLVSSVRQHKEDTVMLLKVVHYYYYQFKINRVVAVPNSVCFCPLGISGGVEVVGHLLECRSLSAERSFRERDLSGPAGEDGRPASRSSEKIKLKVSRLKQIK